MNASQKNCNKRRNMKQDRITNFKTALNTSSEYFCIKGTHKFTDPLQWQVIIVDTVMFNIKYSMLIMTMAALLFLPDSPFLLKGIFTAIVLLIENRVIHRKDKNNT